ncbi:beta-N-acetylhexosaminidase [Pseudobdellovibrio sp. HCB154]|uniref:beta-N-acetylhexosaminidase n=1 Tax=Pseudobdellovibrio sp. HCB154 TaxID=3386277 RepID=UPI0039175018
MKLNELIGQHMLIGVSGHTLTESEKKFIVENNISGVVLFARNLSTPEQIRDLCAEIQSLRHKMASKAPLFIGIDMEGGRVHRLKEPFTKWPPLKTVGDLDAPTVAFHFAHRMGLEMMAVGINLDFAPCVDVFTNPQNTVIGDRAVSSDPHQVEKMASALVRGYIKSGILSCAKHFPGHGHTIIDSHEELPVEEADLKRLHEVELVPFKKALRSRVDMVMTAHILFKSVDKDWPATLSEFFLKKMLRDELKYKGLIITDDLDMKAMAKHYDKAFIPVRALQAGAELLLYCNEPESPPVAIEGIMSAIAQGQHSKAELESTLKHILDVKKIKLLNPDPRPIDEAMEIVGHPDHQYLADCLRKQVMPEGLVESNDGE